MTTDKKGILLLQVVIFLRRPQNLIEYLMFEIREIFHQILWPSQNILTLPKVLTELHQKIGAFQIPKFVL